MVILQNIDIDKISNRFKFGISNRARGAAMENLSFGRCLNGNGHGWTASFPKRRPHKHSTPMWIRHANVVTKSIQGITITVI